jgi:hypothetical protein
MAARKPSDATPWEKTLARLQPATLASLERLLSPLPPSSVPQIEPEDVVAFRDSMSRLNPVLLQKLAPAAAIEEAPSPNPPGAKYMLYVVPDGEAPHVRCFDTAEDWARGLGKLDGDDVYVLPVWGVPLQFTQGPRRWLKLPNGLEAMSVPEFAAEQVRLCSVEDLANELPLQDDGYLGPPLMTASEMRRGSPPPPDRQDVDAGDDDEAAAY